MSASVHLAARTEGIKTMAGRLVKIATAVKKATAVAPPRWRLTLTVAKRLLGEVSWGIKLRVTMSAGMSVLDMATDIFVIVRYMREEETRGYK